MTARHFFDDEVPCKKKTHMKTSSPATKNKTKLILRAIFEVTAFIALAAAVIIALVVLYYAANFLILIAAFVWKTCHVPITFAVTCIVVVGAVIIAAGIIVSVYEYAYSPDEKIEKKE